MVEKKRREKQFREFEILAAEQERIQAEEIKRIELQRDSLNDITSELHQKIEMEKSREEHDLEQELARIQRSTKTSFKKLAPIHDYLRSKSKIYYVWHLNPYSSALHFAALLFFLATAIYSIQALYPVMYQNALADSLTCTWNGSVSSGWDNASNWTNCNSGVPGATDYVSFSGAPTNNLVMTSNKTVAKVESLTANSFSKTFNTNNYDLIVNGNFTWQAGTLKGSASNITVTGDLEFTNGTFTYDTSTFILSGNDSIVNVSKDIYSLVINKVEATTVVTVSTNDLSIYGNLTILSGKLDGAGRNANIKGAGTTYTIGQYAAGGNVSIQYNTTNSSQYIFGAGGIANDNITINKTSGTVTWNGSANIKNLILTSGGLTFASGKIIIPNNSAQGKISCAANQTMTIAGSGLGKMVVFQSDSTGQQWDLENGCGATSAAWADFIDTNLTSGAITATNSIDGGGNSVGFTITEPSNVKRWLADSGADFNTGSNWSGGSVPGSSDVALFSSLHNGDCTLSSNTTLLGLISDSYSGIFSTGLSNYSLNTVGANNGMTWASGTFRGNGSNITLTSDINVTNYFSYVGGSFSSTTATLKFSGNNNVVISGADFLSNGGTVEFTGGQSGVNSYFAFSPSTAYANFTVNKSGHTLNLSGARPMNVSQSTNLTLGKIQSGSIDVNGAINIGAGFEGASILGGATTLLFDGSSTSSMTVPSGAVLPNLKVNNPNFSVFFAAGASSTVMGDIYMLDGTFVCPTTLTLPENNNIKGNGSKFNCTSGDVNFTSGNSGGNYNVDPDSSITFNNITINKSANFSVGSGKTMVAAGNLTLTNGPVNSGTIEAHSNVNLGAGFDGGSGSLTLNGTGNQTYTVTPGGVVPTGTLTINKSNGKAIISGSSTWNNLSLTSGVLEFAPGYTYTMTAGETITTAAGTTLRYAGTAASPITLTVTGSGTCNSTSGVWCVANSGLTYANYVTVDHSKATSTIYAMNSTDGLNNTNWDFASTAKTWDGGASTTVWNDANNWNPDGVPDPNDTVILDTANTITATTTPINFGTLTVGGSNITTFLLTTNIASGGDITISSDGTIEQNNAIEQVITGDLNINGASGHLANLTHTANGTTAQGEMYKVIFKLGNSMSIGQYGKVDVSGKGYLGGNGPGASSGSFSYKAGSYGGQGAAGTVGNTYGSITNPVNIGSGGGGGCYGGGAVLISAAGSTAIAGNVYSDGLGPNPCAAGGSGGSINISTSSLTGSGGIIQSNGGVGYGEGSGGGGGRIALILSVGTTFGDSLTIGSFGGAGGGANKGAAGTIYEQKSTDSSGHGELIVDNNNITTDNRLNTYYSSDSWPKTLQRGDSSSSYQFARITLRNGGIYALDSNDVLDISSTAISGDTDDRNEGIWLEDNAVLTRAAGALSWPNYFIRFGTSSNFSPVPTSISVGDKADFILDKPYTYTGDITVLSGGVITHTANYTDAFGEAYKINLTLTGNLDVQSSGAISVNSKGYLNNNGPGKSASNGSGGYGGQGSIGSCGATFGGITYGSAVNPVNLGSGGTAFGGGAAILVVSGNTIVNGSITADSVVGGGWGGSGGTVNLTSGTLSGSGSISSNGGTGYGCGASSGGGRIALTLTSGTDFGTVGNNNTHAYGGTYVPASAGTVYKKAANQTNGTLTIDNQNTTTGTVTIATLYGNGANCDSTCQSKSTTFDSVTIQNKGKLQLVGTQTLTTTGDLTVAADSELQYAPDNDGTPANGAWPTVNVGGNLSVSGSVTSDGLGFVHDAGAGKGNVGINNGGGAGFGSSGGASSDGGTGGSAYGSNQDVAYIGSGGGSAQGGAGGGHIELNITGNTYLSAAGIISANGDNGTTSASVNGGGGSGGAIFVNTQGEFSTTAGSYIRANGGNGAASLGGGGSGGRIFLLTKGTRTISGTIQTKAGTGYVLGGSGTIMNQASPATPNNSSPADGALNQSQNPSLSFSSNDSDGDYIRYKLQIAKDSNFNWYDNGWQYRQKIVIDHTKFSGNLSDFPLLVNVSDAANPLFTNAQADADDVLFTSSDGTTKLSHEIETYDNSGKAMNAWVKIPAISSTEDTVIYMYYGNAAASSQESQTAVWSNGFAGAYHLSDTSWSNQPNQVINSAKDGYNGQTYNSPTMTTGKIGSAGSFNGSNQYISVTNGSDFGGNSDDGYTLSAWVKTTGADAQIFTGWYTGYKGYFWSGYNVSSKDYIYGSARILKDGGGSVEPNSYKAGNIADGNWHHVSYKIWYEDGEFKSKVIVDGVAGNSISVTPCAGHLEAPEGVKLGIGAIYNDLASQFESFWKGQIDELRYENTTRSDAWIAAEYNNQNAPATFYSLSPEISQSATQGSTFIQTSGSQSVTSNGLTATFMGTGCSGVPNSQSGTAYSSATVACLKIDTATPLVQGTKYYWRVSAWDPAGVDSYDGTEHWTSYSNTYNFTVAGIDKTIITAGAAQTIRTADSSTCSSAITFEVRNAIDESVRLLNNTEFNLNDGGASGNFYSNSNCTGAISNITIPTGSATATFYYANQHSSATTYTLTATDNPPNATTWTDALTTIRVNPGNLDHFSFTGYDTIRTTDQTTSATITAYDSLNNIKFDYFGTGANIWFTSTADSYAYLAVLPAKSTSKYQFQASDNGTKTFSNGFQIKKVGSHTIILHHDVYDGKTADQLAVTSNTISVNPGEAFDFVLENYPAATPDWSKYVVSGSTWDVGGAGAPYNMKVTVKDQFANTKTDYTDRKVWFELYDSQENQASYSFTYDAEGNAYNYVSGDAGIHTFSSSDFMSETSGRNMKLRVRNETIHHDFNIYVKPLGLDHFNISTDDTLSRGGNSWDQSSDSIWSNDSDEVNVTVTAYDVLGYVKTDYAANPDTGYGYIYFWSPERSSDDGNGNYLNNQEFPYYRNTKNAADVSRCFAFPASSAGVHTFTGQDEAFQWLKGGRRKVYVSECVSPASPYAISDQLKDDHITANWPGANQVKSGAFPISNPPDTVAVATHVPGATHLDDQHTDASNNNFTVGPGDQKLSLSWKNPVDVPANTNAKIHIFQSTDGGNFSELLTPRPLVNGAGMWQTQDITGLTNEQEYWFKLKVGYLRSDNSEILSDFSVVQSGTPKAIAPLDVTAVQLERSDTNNPGKVQINFKLRFDSAVTYSYFNPSTLSWSNISDEATSGDKGVLSGNFDDPMEHIAYVDMNHDFDSQYLATSFKIRVNVNVEGQGQSNSESPTMRLDTKNPSSASLIIDATNNETANLMITASDDSLPMQMMVSTKSDYAGADWEDYATSKNNFNISDASHIYLKFRDLYYNDTEINTEIRPVPANLQIKDASNISTGKYRLVLIWDDAANVSRYNIWRSTDNINYDKVDTTVKNGYLDINLDTNNLYAYKVTSEDANHNISLPAGPVSSQPGSAPDVTAEPQVELYGWKQDQGVRAKITWNTDQLADSNVAYSKGELSEGSDMATKDGSGVQIAANPEMTFNHEIWLYNLDPSATYHFKVFSKNEIQIAGYSKVMSFTTPERIPLLIQGMDIHDITIDSAIASWSTSKLATTVVEYSSTPISGDTTPSDAVRLTDSNMNTDHVFNLENLQSGAKYYLRVKTTDIDGNITTSDIYNFQTFSMPTVSSVVVRNTSYNTATIEWNTNVDSDSNVEFGQNGSISGTQGKADSTDLHSVTLIGLEPKTQYSYRVLSKDKFGNLATSAMASFTTASDADAPKVLNVKTEVASTGAADAIKYQAIISWDTDEPATSQIEYAMGIGGDYTDKTEEIVSLNSSHVVILPDLKANSAYHLRIVSKDKVGNVAYSDDISLITPPKEKSLLQVVIKSLEDTFSWVGRLKQRWIKR